MDEREERETRDENIRTFANMVDDLRNRDISSYEDISDLVDEIITEHEHMEHRVYDLEGDLKERDDYIAESKRKNWEAERRGKREEPKEEKEEKKEEKKEEVTKTEDFFDSPKKDLEEEE